MMSHRVDYVCLLLWLCLGLIYYLFWVLMLWDRYKKRMKKHIQIARKSGFQARAVYLVIYTVSVETLVVMLLWPYVLYHDVKDGFTVE